MPHSDAVWELLDRKLALREGLTSPDVAPFDMWVSAGFMLLSVIRKTELATTIFCRLSQKRGCRVVNCPVFLML